MNTRSKYAILTGAAGGIGAQTSVRLLQEGWKVVGIDLAPIDPRMDLVAVQGDATNEDVWQAAIDQIEDDGDLQAVINAAGVQGPRSSLLECSLSDFRRVISANLDSAFLGTKFALEHLSDGGTVVNVGSFASLRGVPKFVAYSAAKHAILGLTRTAAIEGGLRNIRCNAVCPGPTDTEMMKEVTEASGSNNAEAVRARMERANPMRRFADPNEVANAILWLVGETSSYVNGAILTVDGGLTSS